MKEAIKEAYEQIKRADHLVYVSLKYTRTADVIKNIITRLVQAYNYMIEALIRKLESEGKIGQEQLTYGEKVNIIKEEFRNDEKIKAMLEFGSFLRKLDRAEFIGENEFRRHVKMKVIIDEGIHEIDLDTITAYFEKTKKFFEYCRDIILKEES